MSDSTTSAADTQNLDQCLEVVLAVRCMTSETTSLATVGTPASGKQVAPSIFEQRKAIVFAQNVE